MVIAQRPQFLGQDGEKVALEKLRKSAEESGYAIHGGRRVQEKSCSSQIFYCLAAPPNTFPIDFVCTDTNQGALEREFCKFLGAACRALASDSFTALKDAV
jgi:hypothetical protein